jgi:hypothetical protein
MPMGNLATGIIRPLQARRGDLWSPRPHRLARHPSTISIHGPYNWIVVMG